MDSVIGHVKSLKHETTKNIEDTSALNQNTKAVTKQKNQFAKKERGTQHKLENTNLAKEISCTIKSSSMKIWTPVKDLDSVIQHAKSPNLDYTINLEDALVLIPNSETVTKKGSLENQIPEEDGCIQHKTESSNYAKANSGAIKETNMKTWTPMKNLDKVIQKVKLLNLDYTNVGRYFSPESEFSDYVEGPKMNLENPTTQEDEDIQHENTKSAKETSCSITNPNLKTCTTVKDLGSVIQHGQPPNLDCPRNMKDTPDMNRNTKTVSRNQNQIAEEEGDIQHKLESTKCSNVISFTLKSPSMKNWTSMKDLDNVIQYGKSLNPDYTKKLEDTSILNEISETVNKENLINQIAEEKGDINNKLESTKCTKEISCTIKCTSILPQEPNQKLGTKEKLTGTIVFQANISAHCLWTSMLQHKGTYDVSLRTATKFIRKVISAKFNSYASFLLKIPLNKEEFNSLNHISNLYLEQLILVFYKTVAPIKHNLKAHVCFNKHVPKIPMRPYPCKVSVTPYIREISRERYNCMISNREFKIRKDMATITNDTHRKLEFIKSLPTKGNGISVDEILLLFQWSLSSVMTDLSTTTKEILIPKFQEDDLKNFSTILIDIENNTCSSVSRKN